MTPKENGKQFRDMVEQIEDVEDTEKFWTPLFNFNDYQETTAAPLVPPPTICKRCGLVLSPTMGYVCPDLLCPTFMQVTC